MPRSSQCPASASCSSCTRPRDQEILKKAHETARTPEDRGSVPKLWTAAALFSVSCPWVAARKKREAVGTMEKGILATSWQPGPHLEEPRSLVASETIIATGDGRWNRPTMSPVRQQANMWRSVATCVQPSNPGQNGISSSGSVFRSREGSLRLHGRAAVHGSQHWDKPHKQKLSEYGFLAVSGPEYRYIPEYVAEYSSMIVQWRKKDQLREALDVTVSISRAAGANWCRI